MKVLEVFAMLLLFNVGVEVMSEDNYVRHDDESLASIFFRIMKLSDYKVPEVDSSGKT
jgi:hypothetical protein